MKATITFLSLTLLLFSCKKDYHPMPPPATPPDKKWVVSTFAGNGDKAVVNGSAMTASFFFPESVALTPSGTFYITDVGSHRIRKINSGIVSTFAGNDNFGIVDGDAATAQFKSPFSITITPNGTIYTSDDNDNRIRKITPAGQVSTFITLPNNGSYLTSDPQGNLYVSEPYNNRIQKITPNGDSTTFASGFSYPGSIVLDKDGNLFVADRLNNRIKKITPAGVVSNFSGSGTNGSSDGDASSAQFSPDMNGMVIDSKGNIIIGHLFAIRKVTPQGSVTTIAGSDVLGFADGTGPMARFGLPGGLAIDANDNVYIADIANNRIRKLAFE
ncbi:MAG: hypothetical protein JST68_23810 [Bacteroidetes bacterium]|nr:hypothetical protein [Bacteroidota bacterium]